MAQDSDSSKGLGFAEIELDHEPSKPIGRIPQNAHCGNCKKYDEIFCLSLTEVNVCILWADKEADNIEKRSW